MGLLDAFTGDAAKEAAQKNAQLYTDNETQGLGFLNSGLDFSRYSLDNAIGAYAPLTELGNQYGKAVNLYQDALGVNGPQGNARATSAFQSAPGYQFQLDQGLQAVDRGAASRGMLGSGNTLMAEQKYGSDLANQNYNNYLTQLGGFVNPQLQATTGANAGIASGYNNLGTLGQNDAQNRVNLATTTTSGIANSNTAAANAQTQASANLLGGLFSLGGNLFKGAGTNMLAGL